MNAKEKRLGTKAQLRAIKNRERRMATAISLAFILLIVVFSAYFTYTFLNQPQNQTTNPTSSSPQLKAAIVDQLSLTIPNQTFIETATNTLKQANYSVDYHSGEKVTVEFYRNLPKHGYSIIIFRVHSTTGYSRVDFFTSEPYSKSKYTYEQLTDRVYPVVYSSEDAEEGIMYFGITQLFVKTDMTGTFSNTTIIMMGCQGLNNTRMAKAFIEKGAKVYMGWTNSVSASHTDQAITNFLQHLILEKQTIKQAVDKTMKEVGPDPAYNSLLIYYPVEAGEQTIENIKR